MLPSHLILKLILTPLIIAFTTLIVHHWGETIGGLIVGLPLTSGPVSVFFAVEQSRQFAAAAAVGAMLGMISVSVFCVIYTNSARRLPWYLAAALGISMYLVTVWSLSFVSPGLILTAVIIPVVLALALLALGKPINRQQHSYSAPWWDLPLRMLAATTLLVLITTLAGSLGPKWSGLLSPFPIFTFVMAVFAHSQNGAAAVWRWMHGVLSGLFSYTAFFLVVGLLIERASLPLVYSLAAVIALTVNALGYRVWDKGLSLGD